MFSSETVGDGGGRVSGVLDGDRRGLAGFLNGKGGFAETVGMGIEGKMEKKKTDKGGESEFKSIPA
jgi:hypothetical protein